MSFRRAAAIALTIILVLVYFSFTKDIPFTHGHRVNAYFTNTANITPGSPVRIAGVAVGKVNAVVRPKGSNQVKLELDLQDKALPVHTDATAKIRPRIFLEGNFFVDLRPGSPSAPEIEDNGTIPAAQTSSPVQLDQLLSAVNHDAREGLASVFEEIGTSLNTVGTPEENADQDPDVKTLTGGQALNRALRYGPDGFRGGARVFDSLIGKESDDSSEIFAGFRDFNVAFNQRETQLATLLGDFAATIGAFSANELALTQSTKAFSRIAIDSEPTLRKLNILLPRLRRWANELAPNLDELPETVRLAYPWIDETTALLADDELETTARLSQPTVKGFAQLAGESVKTLPEFDRLARCWSDVWYQTLIQKVDDGAHSTGAENYKEFWYALAGFNGQAQSFDGNGPYLRLAVGPGQVASGPTNDPERKLVTSRGQDGIRPALPAKNPALQTDVACYKNAVPNLAPSPGSN